MTSRQNLHSAGLNFEVNVVKTVGEVRLLLFVSAAILKGLRKAMRDALLCKRVCERPCERRSVPSLRFTPHVAV